MSGRQVDFDLGFPACAFYLDGFDTETLEDNAPHYTRTWRFKITVYQEIANKAKPTAEADLQDAIEALCTSLEADWNLGGNVLVTVLNSGSSHTQLPDQGPCTLFTITLQVKTFV